MNTYMHQHAYHPPLNPFLPLSLIHTGFFALPRLKGWMVGVAPALSNPLHSPGSCPSFASLLSSLLPLLPFILFLLSALFPSVCLCHQLGLAGSQAALGSARLAFPLWHGTTGPSCCVHGCVCKCVRMYICVRGKNMSRCTFEYTYSTKDK